jgi:P pilus assembly chaperone PapD
MSIPTVDAPFSLLISPDRLVLKQSDLAAPQRFLVVNRGKDPARVTVQERNFTGAPDGSMHYQPNTVYAAADWLTVTPSQFTLASGAEQTVMVSIEVPERPEPGDHQVALVFLVPAAPVKSNAVTVRINRGIATPLYITVNGRTDNTAMLASFTAPAFVTGGGVSVSARIEDTGNVHRDFRGSTHLAVNASGTMVSFPDFTVLRGSTRDVSIMWQPPIACICHLTVAFRNASGATQSASVRVIVFPLWETLAFLAVVGAALTYVLLRRRRRRRLVAGSA